MPQFDMLVLFFIDTGQCHQFRLARVLFDFHALSSRELSVKKGDIVIIHRPINHHWVEIEDTQSGLKVKSKSNNITNINKILL